MMIKNNQYEYSSYLEKLRWDLLPYDVKQFVNNPTPTNDDCENICALLIITKGKSNRPMWATCYKNAISKVENKLRIIGKDNLVEYLQRGTR